MGSILHKFIFLCRCVICLHSLFLSRSKLGKPALILSSPHCCNHEDLTSVCFSLFTFVKAHSVTVPVSIHPLTNAKQLNKKKKKQHRSDISLLKPFFLFFFLHHVETCSYLPSELPQRGRTKKREGGGEDEERRRKKEGRHAVKTKGQTSYSCFSVPFQRMEEEEGGGVCRLEGRLVSLCFPSVRWNLWIPSSPRTGFWRFTAINAADLLQNENSNRQKKKTSTYMNVQIETESSMVINR